MHLFWNNSRISIVVCFCVLMMKKTTAKTFMEIIFFISFSKIKIHQTFKTKRICKIRSDILSRSQQLSLYLIFYVSSRQCRQSWIHEGREYFYDVFFMLIKTIQHRLSNYSFISSSSFYMLNSIMKRILIKIYPRDYWSILKITKEPWKKQMLIIKEARQRSTTHQTRELSMKHNFMKIELCFNKWKLTC